MNVVREIFKRADARAAAVICDSGTISYGQLRRRVEGFSAQLSRLRPAPSSRVGLLWPDEPGYVVIALALLDAGCCLVPVAGELADAEREALCERTGLAGIISPENSSWPHAASGECALAADGLRARWTPLAGGPPRSFSETDFAALNPAFVRFSSGTTGISKGIVLSHESLVARIRVANEGLRIGSADRVLWILPMAHHFAVSIVLYLWSGAAAVLPRSRLAPELLDAAIAHRATVLYAAPFHHRLLAAEPSGRAWPSLRLAVSTSSALPPPIAEGFSGRFGIPLAQGLGIIEVGLPLLNLERAQDKPESVGRPLPGFEAGVVDESGREVARGEAGELVLRGPGMCDAYLSPWAARAQFCRNGWFRTGDIARRDADGDFFLLGRLRSVINVGGMKCFPEEIEEVINAFPGVQRSRVFGRVHPEFGAVPVAEIELRRGFGLPQQQDLIAHCKRRLARFKIPVEFQFAQSIPLTPSGKIKRIR